MKFSKKDFSVSAAVSVSLFRKRSSIWRITGSTRPGSLTRAQIMPIRSAEPPFARTASSR
ncbi:hypothetical protein D3C83_179190 [compost metagenome]